MQGKRDTLFGLAIAMVAACLQPQAAMAAVKWNSPAPARVETFTGIIDPNALASGSPGPIANASQMNVAVILSENTKRQVAWSSEVTGRIGGMNRVMSGLFAGGKAMDEWENQAKTAYDVKFITDSVMQPLVQRFKSLEIVDGIGKFHEGNYDLLVVLDVSFVNTFNTGFFFGESYQEGATVNTYFIDRKDTLAGKVEVTRLKKTSSGDFLKGVTDVRAEVLAAYKDGLLDVFGPVPAPGAVIRANPDNLPVEERLRKLDDLVRQGLITEEEAAAKRAELLKEL